MIREFILFNKYILIIDVLWIVKDMFIRFVDCLDNDKKRDILWCLCFGKESFLFENNVLYVDLVIVIGNDIFMLVIV